MRAIYLLFLLIVGIPCSQVLRPGANAQQAENYEYIKIEDREQASGIVQKKLEAMVKSPELASANISFYAVNLETGKVVADYNSSKSLTPASTMKVVTTAAALLMKGPDYRFVTKVGYRGTLQPDGTLVGDVVIKAGGDPSMGSGNFYKDRTAFMTTWAESLQKAGIRKVQGDIVADISIFKPHMPLTWIYGDMGTYFGAHAHPLNIFDNEFAVSFKTCATGEEPQVTAMIPNIPGLKFKMDVIEGGEGDYVVLAGAPNKNERYVTGTLPPNTENFSVQGSIPNPSLLVADIFQRRLVDKGIEVTGETKISHNPIETVVVDSLVSPTLQEIIKVTNVKSINTYAENLLMHTALWSGKVADPVTAGKNLTRFYAAKGANTYGMFMDDGSGLSRSNGLTAKNLVGVLETVYHSPYCSNFMKSLPVSGRSGSLTSIGGGTSAQDNMVAKSGYMTRARSYAGFVKNKKDENIAFAILVNNYTTTPQAVKYKMANVMVSLAES